VTVLGRVSEAAMARPMPRLPPVTNAWEGEFPEMRGLPCANAGADADIF
jgi:hypothetical protein